MNIYDFLDESIFRLRNWKRKIIYLNPRYLTMKKYDIYLPLKYNDGKKIESRKLKEVRQQLMAIFAAMTVSSMAAPYQGTWRYGGLEFVDNIVRIEILSTEDHDSYRFFKNFKRQLKRSLRQLDILITVQDIQRI